MFFIEKHVETKRTIVVGRMIIQIKVSPKNLGMMLTNKLTSKSHILRIADQEATIIAALGIVLCNITWSQRLFQFPIGWHVSDCTEVNHHFAQFLMGHGLFEDCLFLKSKMLPLSLWKHFCTARGEKWTVEYHFSHPQKWKS